MHCNETDRISSAVCARSDDRSSAVETRRHLVIQRAEAFKKSARTHCALFQVCMRMALDSLAYAADANRNLYLTIYFAGHAGNLPLTRQDFTVAPSSAPTVSSVCAQP